MIILLPQMAFPLAHDGRTVIPENGIRFGSLDFVAAATGDLELITPPVPGQGLRWQPYLHRQHEQ